VRRRGDDDEGVVQLQHDLSTPLAGVGKQIWRGSLLLADYFLHNHQKVFFSILHSKYKLLTLIINYYLFKNKMVFNSGKLFFSTFLTSLRFQEYRCKSGIVLEFTLTVPLT